MVIKKIFFSFLMVFHFLFAFGQLNGSVVYEIKSIDFQSKENSKPSEVAKQTLIVAKQQKFGLHFTNSKSKFFSISKEMETESKEQMLNRLASIRFTSSFNYFIDKNLGVELFQYNDGTLVKNNYKLKNWEITTETKNIDKYLCYKAIYEYNYLARDNKTKTRTITAWFAPSLPYSYGPKNYNGLPGLILELQDWDTTFLATKIELSDKEMEINFPKGKIITEEEYNKKISSY